MYKGEKIGGHTHLVVLVRWKPTADIFPTSVDSMIRTLAISGSVAMRSTGIFQIVSEMQFTSRKTEPLDGDTKLTVICIVQAFSKMPFLHKQK